MHDTAPGRQTAITDLPPDVAQAASQEYPDEVKRLEKAYDLAKEMFNFSENLIKTIDEKSRNSVTTASAIAAFAFLVRKPDRLDTLPERERIVVWCLALLIGVVYATHFLIVRPQDTKTVNPEQMATILDQTTLPEEVVFFNFQTLSGMYAANLKTSRLKARGLVGQNFALAFTLLMALAYLATGNTSLSPTGGQSQGPSVITSPVPSQPASGRSPATARPAPAPIKPPALPRTTP
jgi:hypothetical protein